MKRIRRNAEDWKKILDDFEKGGLSTEKYCVDKDFSAESLYAWKRRLFRRKKCVVRRNGFVQLSPPPNRRNQIVRIETPNGYRIDFSQESDGIFLKNILPILLSW